MAASAHGCEATVSLLIEAGASVDVKDKVSIGICFVLYIANIILFVTLYI